MKGISGLFAVVMFIFFIVMIILLYSMVGEKETADIKRLSRTQDIQAARGAFDFNDVSARVALDFALQQAVFRALDARFGFNETFEPRPDKPPDAPSEREINAWVFAEVANAISTLPPSARALYRNREKSIGSKFTPSGFAAAQDRVSGDVKADIIIGMGDTTAQTSYTITPLLNTSLLPLVRAYWMLAGITTQLFHRFSIIDTPSALRTLQTHLLLKQNEIVQTDLEELSHFAHYSTQWSSQLALSAGALQFSYLTAARLSKDRPLITSPLGMAGCGVPGERFQRLAGAIEKSDPGRLLAFIENPRALVYAIIDEESGWDPAEPMLKIPGLTPSANIRQGVEKLLASFKSAAADQSSLFSQNIFVRTALENFFANKKSSIDRIASKYAQWSASCRPVARDRGRGLAMPADGAVISCFGDGRCTGGPPAALLGDKFARGIKIYAPPGTEVRAALGGRILPDFTRRVRTDFAITSSDVVMMHQIAVPGGAETFFTVYRNVNVAAGAKNSEAIAVGEPIGRVTASASGQIPHVEFFVFDLEFNAINPCLWLDCPQTPKAEPGAAQVPAIQAPIAGPHEYAIFLTAKNKNVQFSTDIIYGEGFCSLSDETKKGFRALSYKFYEKEKDQDLSREFLLWSPYWGKVVRVVRNREGNVVPEKNACGGTVWVKYEEGGEGFIMAFNNIAPNAGLAEGKVVGPYDIQHLAKVVKGNIGEQTAANAICPDPHLEVEIFRESYTLRPQAGTSPADLLNACGTRTDCDFDPIPTVIFSPDNTKPVDVENRDRQHCAALEWEAIASKSFDGMLWKHYPVRGALEKAPLEIRFNALDSKPAVDCKAQPEGTRVRLLNPSDALCFEQKFWQCAPGDGARLLTDDPALVLSDRGEIKRTAGRGQGQAQGQGAAQGLVEYTCYVRRGDTLNVPRRDSVNAVTGLQGDLNKVYQNYLGTRTITKLCSPEDERKDWFCCTAAGKKFDCPNQALEIKGDELRCTDEAGARCLGKQVT